MTCRFIRTLPHGAISAIDGRGGIATKSFSSRWTTLISWTRRGGGLTTNPLTAVIHDGRQFVAAGYGVI